MAVRGIERVALQVKDLDEAIALFAALLGTTFHRQELQLGDRHLHLAFSPLGIELLQEVSGTGSEGLRSVHLRVDSVAEARAGVEAANGVVLAAFRVGTMEHLITQVGPFRLVFVAYPGDNGLAALTGREPAREMPDEPTERGGLERTVGRRAP